MQVRMALYVLLLLICFSVPAIGSRFYVKGTIVHHASDSEYSPIIYMYKLVSVNDYMRGKPGLMVDSARIGKDGTFTFRKRKVISPNTFYWLVVVSDRKNSNTTTSTSIITDNIVYLLLQPDSKIEFRTELARFDYALWPLKMDAANLALRRIYAPELPANEAVNKINSKELQNEKNLTKHKNIIYDKINDEERIRYPCDMDLESVIDTLSNPYISLFAFITSSPFDSTFTVKMNNRYQREIPQSPYSGQLFDFIFDYLYTLPVGCEAPAINLPDSSGKIINNLNLSGKYIMVDFWASWCQPCRMENKEFLKPLYRKYGQGNFYILSISLDIDPNLWKQALKTDSLEWPGEVCDKLGVQSPAAKAYRVTDLPVNYIIDPDGRIIAKNLHGKELYDFIASKMN